MSIYLYLDIYIYMYMHRNMEYIGSLNWGPTLGHDPEALHRPLALQGKSLGFLSAPCLGTLILGGSLGLDHPEVGRLWII